MEDNNNKTTDPYDHEEGLRRQREYNRQHMTESDAENNDLDYAKEKAEKHSTENEVLGGIANTGDDDERKTDTEGSNAGYKQTEDEEMNGEKARREYEENRDRGAEEGGAKNSHGVGVSEAGNLTGENDITENTKERATIDLSGRSVI